MNLWVHAPSMTTGPLFFLPTKLVVVFGACEVLAEVLPFVILRVQYLYRGHAVKRPGKKRQ